VLATKIGGRAMWVERGVARLPTRSVEHMLVLIGITLDPETRKAVEDWSRGERAEDELRTLMGPAMDTSEVARVRDHQRPDFTDGIVDTEAENALFDFLLQESNLDERATPDMVRRASPPHQPTGEAAGDGPDDLSVSTTLQSGPPFCPTLCVRTSQATPPRPDPGPDDEPLLSDEETMVPSPPGATPRLQETPSRSIESDGMVVVGPPSSPLDLSSSMSGPLHLKRTQEPPNSLGAGSAAAGGLVVGIAAMSLLLVAAIVGMAVAYTVM